MNHANQSNSTSTLQQSPRGWCYPRVIRRFGEALLGQQLWCWGRDIEHQPENLLLRYGFARHRDRVNQTARSTCYRLDDNDMHLALWGFGMFYGRRQLGGIFVSRFDFLPKWGRIESLALGIHFPDQLPPLGRPSTGDEWRNAHALYRKLMLWIAQYERWVIDQVGLVYRDQCVARWLNPFLDARQMSAAWTGLARRGWGNDPRDWLGTFRPPEEKAAEIV